MLRGLMKRLGYKLVKEDEYQRVNKELSDNNHEIGWRLLCIQDFITHSYESEDNDGMVHLSMPKEMYDALINDAKEAYDYKDKQVVTIYDMTAHL